MNLYILRHAIAVERGTVRYPNDDRPLTPEGISKMKKEAECFPWLIKSIDMIFSSPLSRAKETAHIAAKSLKAESKIHIIDALLPDAKIENLFTELNSFWQKENIMIVGHEPQLSLITSALIGVDDSVVDLKKGGLCLVAVNGAMKKGSGKLQWLFRPKHLRALA